MKKIYLHIGVHKTGSSSIQESLFQERHKLKKQGFHYFCEDFDGKERALPRLWVDSSSFDRVHIKSPEVLNRKLHEIDSQNIIISIEDLSWFIEEKHFSSILTAFKNLDVNVICYVRRQDQQLISYMQEGSKSRHKPSIRYYGRTIGALPLTPKYEYLNYEKRYLNWIGIFTKENVIFKCFESACSESGDIVLDFSKTIGIKNINSIRVNESLGFKKTKIGHLLNRHTFINSDLEDFIRNNLHDDIKNKLLPQKSEAKIIYKKFIDSNNRLNKCISKDSETLFKEDFSMYDINGNEQWTEEVANQVIIDLVRIFDIYTSRNK